MKKQEQKKRGEITHVMASGEVRDSVTGYVTSVEQLPESARRLLYEMLQGKHQKDD
ncbi:MAG: hypothetical protein PHU31_10170 [Anaerotignum sp.]|nr:hypothetical protein [Anaerotignum sp.]